MNLFVLDSNFSRNAEAHMDRHVVKMPLEAAQLACTALREFGVEAPYKATHRNHPCALWARATRWNYDWTCLYGLALCKEYHHRYQKQHKCAEVLRWCLNQYESIPAGALLPFAQAMPEQHRRADAVEAYRNYYRSEKRHLAQWKNRQAPEWWESEQQS